MGNNKDIIGKKFGRLTDLKLKEVINKNRTCEAICECGNIKDYIINNLKKGNTTSCGCFQKEVISDNKYLSKYNYNEEFFKILNEKSFYVLGLLYTDGNLAKDKYTTFLNLQEKDKHILEDLSLLIKGEINLLYLKPAKSPSSEKMCQGQFRLSLDNKIIYKDLLNLGLFPKKSKTIIADERLIKSRDFWRGVMDGDGCIYVNEDKKLFNLSLCGGSVEFINQFKDYCLSILETKSKVKEVKEGVFAFNLTGWRAKKIFIDLYKNSNFALK